MEKTVNVRGQEFDVKSVLTGIVIGAVGTVGTYFAGKGIKCLWNKTTAYIKAAHAAGKQELAQTQAETKPEEVK